MNSNSFTKSTLLTLLLVCLYNISISQSKTIQLIEDSTKIYFRYFYKSKRYSERHLNDSVRLVGRKITENKLYIDKFINKKKIWTKIYKIEQASDSLPVTTRIHDRNGSKFIHTKEVYYNAILVEN